jgi:hypothetical protein
MPSRTHAPKAARLAALLLLATHCVEGTRIPTEVEDGPVVRMDAEAPPVAEQPDGGVQPQLPDTTLPDDWTPPDAMSPDGGTPPDELTWSDAPEYVPDVIVLDARSIAYLLSREHRQVFRNETEDYHRGLQPIALGAAGAGALSLAVVENRLYVGYDSGEINFFDTQHPSAPARPFAALPEPVRGLTPIGDRLMALGDAAGSARHHLFDASGIETARSEWSLAYDSAMGPRYFEGSTYDPVLQRFYFFCDEAGARDVCAEHVDTSAGTLGAHVYAQDHVAAAAPIRVSVDGTRILTGTGMWYDADGLRRHPDPLTAPFADAAWLPGGEWMVIRSGYGFERRDGIGRLLESDWTPGTPYAVFPTRTGRVVIGGSYSSGDILIPGPTFDSGPLVPDSDADAVLDSADAFPLDAAAALDEDHDGAPDTWNAGSDGSGSPLALDAYPREPACQRLEQGDGVFCNRRGEPLKLPPPRQLEMDNYGIVYLLGDDQVRRWDHFQGQALPPIHLEGDRAPSALATDGQAVLVADDSGSVTTFDFPFNERAVLPAPRELLRLSPQPGLAVSERLLIVQDHGSEPERLLYVGETPFARHAVEDAADTIYGFYNSPFSDEGMHLYSYSTSAGLIDATLDPDTGAILGSQSLPIPGGALQPRLLRVERGNGSRNGSRLLAGNVIYSVPTRAPVAELDPNVVDAVWLLDSGMALLRRVPGAVDATVLERRNAAGEVMEQRSYRLAPLRLLTLNEYLVIVTWNGDPVEATLQFDSYDPRDRL